MEVAEDVVAVRGYVFAVVLNQSDPKRKSLNEIRTRNAVRGDLEWEKKLQSHGVPFTLRMIWSKKGESLFVMM